MLWPVSFSEPTPRSGLTVSEILPISLLGTLRLDVLPLPRDPCYPTSDFISTSTTLYKNCLLAFLFCPIEQKIPEAGDVARGGFIPTAPRQG